MKEKTFERIFDFVAESEKMMELPVELSMGMICTMFDSLCEKHRLDKKETLAMMATLIVQVNKEDGPMYPAEYTG